MTIDQQNINNKKKSKRIGLFFFSLITSLILIHALGLPFGPQEYYLSPLDRWEKSIRKQLEKAASLYVKQQNTRPKKFDDFIVASGHIKNGATLSLDEIQDINKPVEGINTNKLVIYSGSHLIGTYELDHLIKNRFLECFNNQSMYYIMSYFVILPILTGAIFIFLLLLNKFFSHLKLLCKRT